MERNHSSDAFKIAEIARLNSGTVPRSTARFLGERRYNPDFETGTDGDTLGEMLSERKTAGG